MLGFVLSGGGARGAYQAGVYERLAEEPRWSAPGVLSGTSAGAINAALIASRLSPAEVAAFWLELGDMPPVTVDTAFIRDLIGKFVRLGVRRLPSPSELRGILHRVGESGFPGLSNFAARGLEFLLTRRFDLLDRLLTEERRMALADTSALRARLVERFGGPVVPSRGIRLAINAVDAVSHGPVRFVNQVPVAPTSEKYVVVPQITVDMVLASASIPILFPPVRVKEDGNALFWDGGVLVNTPMAPAVALGARKIVPVLCTFEGGRSGRGMTSLGDAVEHLADALLENSYNVDRKLLLERNRVAQHGAGPYTLVDLYRPIRPVGTAFSAGSYLYFQRDRLQEMRELGRHAASEWLESGPELDRLTRGGGATGSHPTVPNVVN